MAACNGNNGSHLYVNDDTGGLARYSLPLTSASKPTYLNTTYYNVWVTFDPSCNLYLTRYFTAVNKYASPYTGSAIGTTTAGASGDPYGVVVNAAGNVFIAEAQANKVIELNSISGQIIQTIAATYPYALALDSKGDLFIGDSNGIEVSPAPYSGITTTILPGQSIQGLAFDSKGDLFAGGNMNGSAYIVVLAAPYKTANILATITKGLATPLGLAVDSAGNVYAPNYGSDTITAYAPPYSSGPFATVTGDLPDGAAIGP
jgi:streptogramin lyase